MSKILGFVAGAFAVFAGLYYVLQPVPQHTAGNDTVTVQAVEVLPPTKEQAPEPARAKPPAQTVPVNKAPSLQEQRQPKPLARPESRLAADTPQQGVTPPAAEMAEEVALVDAAWPAMARTQPPLPVSSAQAGPPAPSSAPAPAAQTSQLTGLPAVQTIMPAETDTAAPVAMPPSQDTEWFAVWKPFHSEYSAKAFAARLEQMTGLDYQVVRSAPATYEVAVAFTTEEERVANIAKIEEATGLRIAGGGL